MSLTFQGHVTWSVMWPFDSPYAIPIGGPLIGTKPLSVTVAEVFNVKCNAMVDVTLIQPLNKVNVIHFGTNRFLTYDFL